jgi:hypothetical protein
VQGVLIGIVILAAVISRPVEARLWRAGRLSDRSAALLLLFGLILGASLPITIGITAITLLLAAVFYRVILDMLRETRQSA